MATAGHFLPSSAGAAARPAHRPPTPALHRPPSPIRARSPVPSSSSSSAAAFASTSKPIPIKEPPAYYARSSRISGPLLAPLTTKTGGLVTDPAAAAAAPQATREATLAEAIRHNDLRALVQNQERARSHARTPRPPSPSHAGRGASGSRSRVAMPPLGGTIDGEEAGGSESSGESIIHIPILDLRRGASDSRSVTARDVTGKVRAGSSSLSPSPGSTSRLPPSSKRRLSCLANYTGILPGQQQQPHAEQQYPPPPVRSLSARAPSPELRYSLSFADRRVSAPPTARPLITRRFSSSNDSGSGGGGGGANARPPSPAPPGFKTSSRRGSGGGGIDGFSPLLPAMKDRSSPSTTVVASDTPKRRASVSNAVPARARSPSPSVSVSVTPTPSSSVAAARGLVRAASPSPRSPPVRAPSPSSSLAAASLARGSSHAGAVGGGGPLVVRGFDAPPSSAAALQIGGGGGVRPPSPSAASSDMSPRSMLPSIPSSSKKPPGVDNGGGIMSMKSSAGPITRPRSSLLDRTADQRLEIRASRDFERIDEYYSTRYAAAAAAAAAVDAQQRAESEAASLRQQLVEGPMTGSASGRERRAEKRLAEERLRRGYDRMA